MIVVADSSPLVVLVGIKQAELLPTLFGQVLIPPQVHDELSAPKRSDDLREFLSMSPQWLKVCAPTNVEPIVGLQAGETAAISLAREVKADRLIIDEKAGRMAATELGLRVIGTVGVLEVAAERRLIELEYVFETLKMTNFWLPPGFLDQRLALFRQRHGGGNP